MAVGEFALQPFPCQILVRAVSSELHIATNIILQLYLQWKGIWFLALNYSYGIVSLSLCLILRHCSYRQCTGQLVLDSYSKIGFVVRSMVEPRCVTSVFSIWFGNTFLNFLNRTFKPEHQLKKYSKNACWILRTRNAFADAYCHHVAWYGFWSPYVLTWYRHVRKLYNFFHHLLIVARKTVRALFTQNM